MADIERMSRALKAADAAGDTEAATKLAAAIRRAQVVEEARPESSFLGGLADRITQGVTYGAGDEITAFESALLGRKPGGGTFDLFNYDVPFDERYERALAAERDQQDRFAEENPVVSTAAEVAGALSPLGVVGRARALGGLAPLAMPTIRGSKTLGAAATGAGAGGVYGFLSGEGGFEERAANVPASAVGGAVAGGVGQKVVAPAIEKTLQGATRALRSLGQTDTRMARGIRYVLQQAEEAGITPDELIRRSDRGEVPGQMDPVLMDLTRAVAREGKAPAAKKTITDRLQEGFAANQDRVTKETKRLLGGQKSFAEWRDTASKRRGKQAAPMYRRAYDEGDAEIWSPELERLASVRQVRSAMQNAINRWELASVADGFGAAKPRALVEGGLVKFQSGGIPVYPNLQFWDYTKRSLDSMVKRALRQGDTTYARDLGRVTEQLRNELDRLGPKSYRQARQKYATASEIIDASELGESLLNMSGDQAEFAIKDLNEAQLQAVRNGVAAKIEDWVERGQINRDVIKRLYNTKRSRRILNRLFKDPKQARRFMSEMETMADFNDLRQVVTGNTRTQKDISASEALNAGGMVQMAKDFVGSPREALVQVIADNLDAATGMPRQGIEAMADLLIADNPQAVRRLVDLADQGNKQAIATLNRRVQTILRASPVAIGGVVGGEIAAP